MSEGGRLCGCGSAVGGLSRNVFAHLHATVCIRASVNCVATLQDRRNERLFDAASCTDGYHVIAVDFLWLANCL